jgi:hypothetical protein
MVVGRNRSLVVGLATLAVFAVVVGSAAAAAAPPGGAASVRPAASSPGHSPVPTFSSAYAVSCPRASYCLAAGAYNANDVVRPITELWNGSNWSVLPTPAVPGATSGQLNAISCAADARCVAVGSYTDSEFVSWPLIEAWNGRSWSIVGNSRPDGAVAAQLNGVSCVGTSFCTAVGTSTNSQAVPGTLVERWDGSSWTQMRSPNPGGASSSSLAAVSCAATSVCMAVGSYVNARSVEVALAETWTGSAWSIVRTPRPSGAQQLSLAGVSCPRTSRCVAVGSFFDATFVARTLAETWNGAAWTVTPTPSPSASPSTALYAVSCATATACLAVGHSYSASAAAKDDTLAESWSGSAWTLVPTRSPSTTSVLYGVSCSIGPTCLAAGLFFDSSGSYQTLAESWHGASLAIVSQDAQLAAVTCVGSSWCVAVGSRIAHGAASATLAEFWDGRSWWTVPTPAPSGAQGSYLTGVSCHGARWCVAVGYYYAADNSRRTLVETWDGTRWAIATSPNPAGAAYSVLYAVSCATTSSCLAVGSAAGRVLAESWKGTRWTIVPSADPSTTAYGELTGLTCSSATRCLAVGYETDTLYHADLTLAEEWDGSAWTIVPSAAPGRALSRSSALHAMSCGAPGQCLAVGYRQTSTGSFDTLSERWTGHSWVTLNDPDSTHSPYRDLNAISCIPDGTCVAVGTHFTTAGDFVPLAQRWTGARWQDLTTPATPPLASKIAYLRGVSCVASLNCPAVGAIGSPADLRTIAERIDATPRSVDRPQVR